MDANGASDRLKDNLLSPKAENMAGFFETRDLVDTSEYLLKVVNATWDRPYLAAPTWNNPQLIKILSGLRERFAKYQIEPWLDKDPRVCLLWTAYSHILLREPCGIMIVRHPLEVADSLKKRNGFSTEKSALIWWLYHYHLITSASPERLNIIEDSSLMKGDIMTIRKIISFMVSQQGISISESDFIRELDRSRIPKLRRACINLNDGGQITNIVKDIWNTWKNTGLDDDKIRHEFSKIPNQVLDSYDALLGQGADKMSPPITKEFTLRCNIARLGTSGVDLREEYKTYEHKCLEELTYVKYSIKKLELSIDIVKENQKEFMIEIKKKDILRILCTKIGQAFKSCLVMLLSSNGGTNEKK